MEKETILEKIREDEKWIKKLTRVNRNGFLDHRIFSLKMTVKANKLILGIKR